MRRLVIAVIFAGLSVRPAWSQVPMLPPLPGAPQPIPPSLPQTPPPSAPSAPSPFPARMTIIDPKGVDVRSGPTMDYYPTNRLRPGDSVIVLRESQDQPGWYAIAPPTGSFSWIDGKYVKQVDAYTGVVEGEGNGSVPVMPGSSIVNKEPNVESAKVSSGFIVQLLERPIEANGKKWYRIASPPNEARFIPKDAVQQAQAVSVTAPNWTRPTNPPSAPGQLTGNPNNTTVGTPASFNQPASQWSQYNGVSAQPPQWSQWGKLRRSTINAADGQPMYVLENRQGQPLLYVTSTPGTTLSGYINRDVCLYGAISYRSDGYMRTYFMTASHVATP